MFSFSSSLFGFSSSLCASWFIGLFAVRAALAFFGQRQRQIRFIPKTDDKLKTHYQFWPWLISHIYLLFRPTPFALAICGCHVFGKRGRGGEKQAFRSPPPPFTHKVAGWRLDTGLPVTFEHFCGKFLAN